MINVDPSMESIAKRIHDRRIELGYSYQDLASRTGMNKSSLQRYENGSISNVPLHRLKTIADALEVSPEWLMGWSENQESNALQEEVERFINSPGGWNNRVKTKEGVLTLPIGFKEFSDFLEKISYKIVLDGDGQYWIESPERRTSITNAELLNLFRTSRAAIGGIAESLLRKE